MSCHYCDSSVFWFMNRHYSVAYSKWDSSMGVHPPPQGWRQMREHWTAAQRQLKAGSSQCTQGLCWTALYHYKIKKPSGRWPLSPPVQQGVCSQGDHGLWGAGCVNYEVHLWEKRKKKKCERGSRGLEGHLALSKCPRTLKPPLQKANFLPWGFPSLVHR